MTLHTSEQRIHAYLNDPGESDWIKRAIGDLLERDCLDAANDAERLASLFGQRADEILQRSRGWRPGDPL